MADRLQGGVIAGSTSVSVRFKLNKTTDGTEQTGKVAANMTASYWRQGDVRTAITVTDLGSVNAAFSAGGVKEVDAVNMPGVYRLDVPDAAWATGAPTADWVVITIVVAGCFVAELWIPISSIGEPGLNTLVTAIKAKTDNLPSAVPKNVAFTLVFGLLKAADPSQPLSGVTPTVTISKDTAVPVGSTNTAVEIAAGTGSYFLSVTAAEMNANAVHFDVSAPGAIRYKLTIYTKPN